MVIEGRVGALGQSLLSLTEGSGALLGTGAFRFAERGPEHERNRKRQPECQAALPSPQHGARP